MVPGLSQEEHKAVRSRRETPSTNWRKLVDALRASKFRQFYLEPLFTGSKRSERISTGYPITPWVQIGVSFG